ncbi:MAG: hypothetical protein Ct9H90mP11_01320 [Acidimicrobiales bacterium]|nr:MAG: hypothetical protein Ct9H90mP11_01320 [Acidimicrobiales bacterium]
MIEEEVIGVDEKAEETFNTIITGLGKKSAVITHSAQQRPMDTSIK